MMLKDKKKNTTLWGLTVGLLMTSGLLMLYASHPVTYIPRNSVAVAQNTTKNTLKSTYPEYDDGRIVTIRGCEYIVTGYSDKPGIAHLGDCPNKQGHAKGAYTPR